MHHCQTKKSKKFLQRGATPSPDPSPTGEGIPPPQTAPPSALGVPVPFQLRLEHCIGHISHCCPLQPYVVIVFTCCCLHVRVLQHQSIGVKIVRRLFNLRHLFSLCYFGGILGYKCKKYFMQTKHGFWNCLRSLTVWESVVYLAVTKTKNCSILLEES